MTAPFVATVTKPPSGGVVGRSRLQRALLVTALLLPLLMAIALLAWMAVPRAGAGQGRTSWMDRLFGGTDGEGLTRIQSEETICSLPKKIGPCRGAMPRFFYSTDSGVCQSFLYGGCDGNANNFETIEECTSHCGIQTSAAGGRKSTQRADCSLPKKIGPCRGVLPRFFYSTESGVCQSFFYGGCDGNANNFETIEECTSHCGVQPTGSETHEGQDKEGGAAICTLPKVVGDCRAAMPRYYFDVKTSACQEFTYGGCGGNGNNFETLHDCEKMCSSAKSGSTGESDCSSEPDGGICMAYMERYAFHPATRSCEKFVYGGCGGNGNRYSSKEECEEHCAAGGDREKPTELVEGTDYDTTLCGMAECPMDCGVVGRRDGCLLCQCGHTPFTDPDEVAVPADKPCPPGYSLNRHDHGASVCTPDMAEPVPAE